jgi:hypothetical protein
MPISRDILRVIRVGEENAITAQLLWRKLNLWSFASEMVAADLAFSEKQLSHYP